MITSHLIGSAQYQAPYAPLKLVEQVYGSDYRPPTQRAPMATRRTGSGFTSTALAPTVGRFLPGVLPQPYQVLTPGTMPGPGPLDYAQTDVGGMLTNTGCNLISDPYLRAACVAAGTLIFNRGGNGGGSTNLQPPTNLGCPQGYKPAPNGGCQLEGMGPYLPGDVGRQDFGWGAVNGRWGAGYQPITVQRTYRACPPGAVLGKDGVCYDRLARTNREHNPGAKPFMTGGQVNTLRKAKALQKRGRKLMAQLAPAPRRCAPSKRRKR